MNKLYKYNQNKLNFKTSTEIGEITPIYWNKLYPGEKLKKLSFQNLTRMISPELPTMDNPYVEIFTFAVPKRLLLPQFKNGAGTSQLTSDIFVELSETNLGLMFDKLEKLDVETIETYFGISPYSYKNGYIHNKDNISGWGIGRNLFSRFGINKDFRKLVKNSEITGKSWANKGTEKTLLTCINLMYLLAYWKIYESFFKNKQLETFKFEKLFQFYGQYFENTTISNNTIDQALFPMDVLQQTALKAFLHLINKVAIANTNNEFLNDLTLTSLNPIDLNVDWNTFNSFLGRNYSKNKMIVEQMQNGTEKDLLLKIWNANNQDKTQAKLIGYYRYDQKINQVIQTSGSTDGDNNLGETGGYSLTYNNSSIASDFVANEETYIITVAVPNYRLVMNNSFEQQEWLSFKVDGTSSAPEFVNGEFMPNYEDSLQFQEPLFMYYPDNKRFFESDLYLKAGFRNGFDFLRHKKNSVGGQIPEYYNDWNYSANIYTDNSVNMSLLKTPVEPFKKTLIGGTEALDSFIMDFNFQTEILRHIKPIYDVEEKVLENE